MTSILGQGSVRFRGIESFGDCIAGLILPLCSKDARDKVSFGAVLL
jgi:hypothetical protein